MATNKAASTKKATVKKPASKAVATKTNVRTLRSDDRHVSRAASVSRERRSLALPNNIVNVVLAELVGTMVLTFAALTVVKETGALYAALVYALLVLAAGAVSGGHFNPAVSFGLWTMRRLRSLLLPFYWGAQFLGAMLAVIVMNLLTNNALKLSFDHFGFGNFNWAVFGVELVGTAVFLYGLAAVRARLNLSGTVSALGSGLALLAGLVVAGSLMSSVQSAVDTSKITDIKDVPHVLRVKGATLNPAVALAATEQTDSSFTGTRTAGEKQYSRLSWEVVLGTLVGAALGGNLYLLIAGRRVRD